MRKFIRGSILFVIGMAIMFAGVALVSWPQKGAAKRLDEDQQKDPSTAGCG